MSARAYMTSHGNVVTVVGCTEVYPVFGTRRQLIVPSEPSLRAFLCFCVFQFFVSNVFVTFLKFLNVFLKVFSVFSVCLRLFLSCFFFFFSVFLWVLSFLFQ